MDQNEALKAYETSHATIPLPEAASIAAVFIEAAAVRPFRGWEERAPEGSIFPASVLCSSTNYSAWFRPCTLCPRWAFRGQPQAHKLLGNDFTLDTCTILCNTKTVHFWPHVIKAKMCLRSGILFQSWRNLAILKLVHIVFNGFEKQSMEIFQLPRFYVKSMLADLESLKVCYFWYL